MMQLTEIETTFIRKRLGVFLENLDFIEEMTDHFILDIERQLNEGIDMQTAFLVTKSSFGGADGLQKLEKTFVKSFKKGIYNEIGQMYLQTLRKMPQNMLLVFGVIASYYLLFENFASQESSFQKVVGIGGFLVSVMFYGVKGHYNKNTSTIARKAIIVGNVLAWVYFSFCIKFFRNYIDVSFLNVLSAFIFCHLVLWTYYGTKILNKLKIKQNKIIISQ